MEKMNPDAKGCKANVFQVIKCKLKEDGQTEELSRVNFSGKDGSAKLSLANESLLVAATSDASLRFDMIFFKKAL